MSAALVKRIDEFRARVALRRWEYRQRNLARGVWVRLARVLADAAEGWAISEQGASALIAEGYKAEPIGRELEPEKWIFFVDPSRLLAMSDKRRVALQLTAPLLTARAIALVRFP